MTSSPSSMKPRIIFPPFHTETAWRAVDDRIRGGSSISHLDPYHSNHRAGEDSPESSVSDAESETWIKVRADGDDHETVKNGAVRFWGTLDTKTLGGAGFASQAWRPSGKSTDSDRPNRLDLPASRYAGLRITYLPIPSRPVTRFTLVLKTKIGHRRPDGRLQSELSWERTIDASSSASSSSAGFSESRIASRAPASLEIPWADFAATYRGRPISPDDPEYYPFVPGREPGGDKGDEDAEGIAEISLMCRSAFGKQEGDFEFIIVSLEATAASNVSSPSASVVASDVEKAASDAEKNEESSILDHQNDDGHPHRDDGRSFFRALWEMCASVAGQAVTLLGQGWQWIGSWLKYLTGSGGVRLD